MSSTHLRVAAATPLADRLAGCLRPDLGAMHAYAVQPSAGMVKLDAMENPFPLPAPLREALGARLAEVAINRYPGARIDDLRAAVARHAGMPDGFGLLLGNGSDEIITLLAMACDLPGATVLAPEPGFVMYGISARLCGLRYVGVPLTARFELDEAAMHEAIVRHRPGLIYIAYPNNPTANLFDDSAIDGIIDAAPGLVVIDEAYQPFASKSYIDRIARHEHVLLLRTLSKFGLAGVRLGYLIGRRSLIDQIDKLRPPYNVSVLNAEAALFAIEHADEFARQAQVLRAERSRLIDALAALPGVTPYPSEANMILVRFADPSAAFEALLRHRVLVKNVAKMDPLLDGCLRLTVGTPEENSVVIEALKASL